MSQSLKVIYDSNVFLQALANPDGPAGRCITLTLEGTVALFISPHVLDEIRDVTQRPKLVAKFRLRRDRVETLLDNLLIAAVVVTSVPEHWTYERDPTDAHYVNLALAAGATLVVSWDKDLLDLMNDANPDGKALRTQHPGFRVLTPPQFLEIIALHAPLS